MHNRVGFKTLYDCLSAPHWNDAKDLQQIIQAYDPCLEVGYCYQLDSRENRWLIRRNNPDGSQVLVKTLEDSDGTYRKPTANVLMELQRDRIKDTRTLIKELDAQEEADQKRKDEAREHTKQIAVEGLQREFRNRNNRDILDPLQVGI
jgi:hypothetical protein